jgi:hypothetical protein
LVPHEFIGNILLILWLVSTLTPIGAGLYWIFFEEDHSFYNKKTYLASFFAPQIGLSIGFMFTGSRIYSGNYNSLIVFEAVLCVYLLYSVFFRREKIDY